MDVNGTVAFSLSQLFALLQHSRLTSIYLVTHGWMFANLVTSLQDCKKYNLFVIYLLPAKITVHYGLPL